MIHNGYFTLEYVNEMIENFTYGSSEISSKPSTIPHNVLNSNDRKINQEGQYMAISCLCIFICLSHAPAIHFMYMYCIIVAAQWWCLAQLLPIMLGDKIPENDEHWENFLTLLDILDYLMAPVISSDEVAHLGTLIEHHHTQFSILYPNSSITPKFHYLTHYPEFIMRYVHILYMHMYYFILHCLLCKCSIHIIL